MMIGNFQTTAWEIRSPEVNNRYIQWLSLMKQDKTSLSPSVLCCSQKSEGCRIARNELPPCGQGKVSATFLEIFKSWCCKWQCPALNCGSSILNPTFHFSAMHRVSVSVPKSLLLLSQSHFNKRVEYMTFNSINSFSIFSNRLPHLLWGVKES